ncbi:unnamed protein product [Camellia sinensis]
MGRSPCCDKTKVKRGPWSPEEDIALKNYVERFGTGGNWIALPHKAGLKRCGKSCRLRWLNYLRPDIKRGGFTVEEDDIILTLYNNIGSRWSVIASHLQGRTDNDVKNYWNTKLKKKLLPLPPTENNSNNTSTITTNNNATHFSSSTASSPLVTNLDTNAYHSHGNSIFSNNMISASFQPAMNVNYQQKFLPQGLVSEEPVVQSSLPRFIEVSEIGSSAADGSTFRGISLSEEVASFSDIENKYGLWSGNGGGDDEDNDDRWLMDLLGSSFSYDLLNSFGY